MAGRKKVQLRNEAFFSMEVCSFFLFTYQEVLADLVSIKDQEPPAQTHGPIQHATFQLPRACRGTYQIPIQQDPQNCADALQDRKRLRTPEAQRSYCCSRCLQYLFHHNPAKGSSATSPYQLKRPSSPRKHSTFRRHNRDTCHRKSMAENRIQGNATTQE